MNIVEYVDKEVSRILDENARTNNYPNMVAARHQIEVFFKIEFEQSQVDAWIHKRQIVDDVLNLWTPPIQAPPPRQITTVEQAVVEANKTFEVWQAAYKQIEEIIAKFVNRLEKSSLSDGDKASVAIFLNVKLSRYEQKATW